MIKKYKNLLNEIHLNYVSEITLLITLNIILIAAMILTIIVFNSPLFIALFVSLLLLSNFVIFNRYFLIKKKIDNIRLESLYQVLGFIYLDLMCGVNKTNVLKHLNESDNLEFNERANKTLQQIETDHSIAPFLTFASFFKSNQATVAIINVYKVINNDDKTYIADFDNAYHLLESEVKTIKQAKLRHKYAFARYSAFIGAIILLLIVVIAIILEIGNKFHG